MTLRTPRGVLALLLAVLAGWLVTPAARAADAPLEATLSDAVFAGSQVTTLLTVRGGTAGADVTPSTLRATIGGRGVTASQFVKGVAGPRSTILLIDTSGSMGSSGMATVRASVASFLANAPADVSIGVVSFSDTAKVNLPPTKDRGRVQQVVNGLTSKGETALYAGVNAAVRALGTGSDRSIVLLSDGGESVNKSFGAQKSAVEAISNGGVRAEVVGFKTEDTQNTILQTFAAAGGGSVASASSPAAVQAAFTTAAKALASQFSVRLTPAAGLAGQQQVVVTGAAGGRPFVAEATVDLGGGVPATPTPTTGVTPGSTTTGVLVPEEGTGLDSFVPGTKLRWWLGLSVLALFLGTFGVVAALLSPAFKSRRKERISMIADYTRGLGVAQSRVREVSSSVVAQQLVQFGDKVMAGREATSRTLQLLERADLPWRAGEWFILRCIAVIIGGAVGIVLGRDSIPLLWLVVGAIGGFIVPAVLLRFLARRRANKFESLLPDVLQLVATSLSSGFSLPQALDAVAKDSAEPAAKEFSRALAETRIGADLSDALDRVSVRMDSESLRWTVMAIRIQRDVGGNLADTLRTTAKTLRERESLKRQVRALSAEGRLSAYILIALPIAVFFYSMWVNYEYVSLLWTHWLGWIMLGMGTIAMIAGVFWMRKVVQIDV